MSSTSPNDAKAEAVLPTDMAGSKYLEGMEDEAEGFESRGYPGEALDDAQSMRAERRQRARRARAQARPRARAVEAAEARYEEMDPYGHMAAEQNRRIDGTEVAIAAGTVVNHFRDSFPDFVSNPYIKAGIPWVPTLLMKPPRRGNGIGAVASDARVWSIALIELVTVASEVRNLLNRLGAAGGQGPGAGQAPQAPEAVDQGG